MRKISYIFLVIAVLLLFAGCGGSNTNTKDKYDVSKLYGTWFDGDAYYVFREDGMCSWDIGKIGDKFFPYTVDHMDITIDHHDYSRTFIFRIEDNNLYLTDHTLEIKYERVEDDQ